MAAKRKHDGETPLEIPGYHYDPDKKTYFKLLPEHKCIHPLASLKNVRIKHPSTLPPPRETSKLSSLPHLTTNRAIGLTLPLEYSHKITETRISTLNLVHKHSEKDPRSETQHKNRDYCLFLVPWTAKNCLIGVCNDGDRSSCKVRAWTVSAKTKWTRHENESCKINIKPFAEPLWYISGKITDVCMGELTPDFPCLFICSAQTRSRPVTHLVVLPLNTVFLNGYGESPFRVEVFKFERNCVWSCCSNTKTKFIIAGLENQLVLFNYAGMVIDTIPIPGQNVLGVSCERSTGRFLYASTNKGSFNGYDLRTTRNPVFSVRLECGVSAYQLEPMSAGDGDDVILLSGYRNYLKAFDLRMRKAVIEYKEHENDYMRIKASLDESENVLSSADKNGVVRLWDASNGSLLKVLPRPDVSYDRCDFASTWFRGNGCRPAQVTVAGRNMYIYQSF